MNLISKIINIENACDYIDDIVVTHHTSYDSNHFTSCFSISKLRDYYLSLIRYSDLTILIIDEGKVVGFIISGENVSQGVNSFVKYNRLYLIKILLANPHFLYQKLRGLFSSKLSIVSPSNAKFRLLSISVNKTKQSSGIGGVLLNEFERAIKEQGYEQYGLSVRFVNVRAINFYIKNGFLLEKVSNGTAYMIKRLS